jgi:hypothetical protein
MNRRAYETNECPNERTKEQMSVSLGKTSTKNLLKQDQIHFCVCKLCTVKKYLLRQKL